MGTASMNPMATRSRPLPTRRLDLTQVVSVMVVVATVAFGVWLIVSPLRMPPRIDLTINNATPFDVIVEAGAPDGEGRVMIGTAERGREVRFEDKVDLGVEWEFSFRYGGVDGGVLQVSRSELETSGWRITVPLYVGDALAEGGLGPAA